MRSPPPELGVLTADERRRLDAGDHEALARDLTEADRRGLSGWVREQIWDFDGAGTEYRAAGHLLDALRVALESGSDPALDQVVTDLEQAAPDVVEKAVALLEKRRRNMEVARLLAHLQSDPQQQAQALCSAGNRVGAAQVLADAGRPRDALEALALEADSATPHALGLAARLCWDLGDAEGAARHAQAALRQGSEHASEVAALLARALGSLGHDLAAQLVLQRHGARLSDDAVPGRYRVTGLLPSALAGGAYVGVDRLTLREVEIHLLLADQPEPIDPRIATAIDRFTAAAQAASEVGHPAIRPVLRTESAAGLLVLPRAEGPPMRQMIRPPGLADALPRAHSLIAFLLEGLDAAHQRGLVHGGVLPSQIATDALGRPQLGPFGSQHLSGLAATRTGGLEELMIMTAPELRRGGEPTPQSDLFAAGALMHALITGRLEAPGDDPAVAPPERALIAAMTAEDPDERPTLAEVIQRLRQPVADVRTLAVGAEAAASRSTTEGTLARMDVGVDVTAAESWTTDLLDALCAEANPWLQPILDRTDRHVVLAQWPQGARVLDDTVAGWRGLIPTEAMVDLPDPLRDAIEARLRPSSVVVTAAGPRMLSLDDLLSR